MKDKGTVLAVKNTRAQVKVSCFVVCHECSARIFCAGKSQNEGILSVINPLNASPGDTVMIDIPVSRYTRSLSLLFGGMLAASLLGLFSGYAVSWLFRAAKTLPSVIGLVLGMIIGAVFLFQYFKKENKYHLNPIISNILTKGGKHGQA